MFHFSLVFPYNIVNPVSSTSGTYILIALSLKPIIISSKFNNSLLMYVSKYAAVVII